jgi:hypothetical protein
VLANRKGDLKVSVINEVGKESVLGVLGAGNFFGEGRGRSVRSNGESDRDCTHDWYSLLKKNEVIRVLRPEHAFSDRFRLYAFTEHPNRGGFDRSAFQLERETAASSAFAARSLRQAITSGIDDSLHVGSSILRVVLHE